MKSVVSHRPCDHEVTRPALTDQVRYLASTPLKRWTARTRTVPMSGPRPRCRTIDPSTATGPQPRRDHPGLDRFATPPWDRHSPQWLEIDDDLPADHLARVIDEVVDQLDLTALFDSYAGVGSRAHRPDLL